jgi:hypothetical protein
MKKGVHIHLLLGCLLLAVPPGLYAQPTCTDNYFVQQYTTATAKHNYSSLSTPQNDVIIAGYVLTGGSLNRSGWLTKISAQGTVLWNKQYNFSFYGSTDFRKIINAGNDNFLVGGMSGDT